MFTVLCDVLSLPHEGDISHEFMGRVESVEYNIWQHVMLLRCASGATLAKRITEDRYEHVFDTLVGTLRRAPQDLVPMYHLGPFLSISPSVLHPAAQWEEPAGIEYTVCNEDLEAPKRLPR